MPGMPSTPLAVEIGASAGSTLRSGRAGADGVFLPAEPILDDVADLVAGMVGLDDLAHRAARHDLADSDGRGVGGGIAHAPAHVGIEREIDDAHENLARPGLGHRHLLDAEIGFGRLGRRAAGKDDAAMGLGDHGFAPAKGQQG